MKNNFEPENHLDATESRWFAVYTRYKREKVVLAELERKGIEVFLPIQKLLRQYGRKKRMVEMPLFSCYVFVKIKKGDYVPVLSTENVVRFIQFSGNLISIPEDEIDIIRRIIGEGILIEAEKGLLIEGDKVEIISGQLSGMQGNLLEIQGKNKVLIELAYLGYTLKLELPTSYLQRLESSVAVD